MASGKDTATKAGKKHKMFFIVERNEITVRKYLVEAPNENSVRFQDGELLGASDTDDGLVVCVTGFATKEEALDSDDANVEWEA